MKKCIVLWRELCTPVALAVSRCRDALTSQLNAYGLSGLSPAPYGQWPLSLQHHAFREQTRQAHRITQLREAYTNKE